MWLRLLKNIERLCWQLLTVSAVKELPEPELLKPHFSSVRWKDGDHWEPDGAISLRFSQRFLLVVGANVDCTWLACGELQCLIKLSPQRFKRKAEETCPAGRALGAIETLHRAPLFIWKRHPALMKLLRDSHLLLLCPVLWITRLRSSVSTVYKIEIVNVFRRGCEVCVMSLCTLASYLGMINF